ncbi:MAG: hypothetical protein ABW208_07130 [Pyrinomonadaceae bacterium]
MAENRLIVEVEVDPDGKASVSLKNLEGDVSRFAKSTDNAGQSGLRLRDVFAGNLLSDFFQRGLSAALQFGAASVQASAAASDANRQLEFSATQAGLSYTRAAAAAEDFGKRVGASNTEAARTFSDLVRLADRAGRSQDIELIGARFADLAAARGLKGAELSNLIGTILSGQDEGLNRLGLPDPSKLYAQYAASIGKTAESLSEMEKAQAALNGVLSKGAEAEGEAEKRLRSTAGQLDTASAAYENLKTQAGDAISTSIEFRDVLDTISDALGGLVTSHAEARRELAKGLKSPEQIAQEEREGFGRQLVNAGKGALTVPASIGAIFRDTFDLATGRATRDEFNTNLQGNIDAFANPGQRQYDARVEQLRALKEEIERQEKEAETRAAANAAKSAATAQRSVLQKQFGDALEGATKEENLSARLDKLKELKEQLKELPGVLDASEAEKQSKKIDDAIRETSKQVAAAVRSARDAVRDFLGDSLTQADKDNPFVSLFVRARNEVEETRNKFLIFGTDFADAMAQVKKNAIDAEIGVARLQSSLQALKYEQEARRLDLPLVGLSGPQERNLAVIDARIAGIEKDVDLASRQRFLENPYRGFDRIDAERQNQQTLDQLRALDVSGAGRSGRESQAQAILSLLNQFDPRTVATSADPFFQDLRQAGISAYQVQRDALKANVEDAIARERAGNLIQEDARELLTAVGAAQGLTRDQRLKEFLAVSGTLSEKELTPDLRRARADLLREAAQAESGKEERAEERARLSATVMEKLDRLITSRGIKVDAPPSNVNLNLSDGLAVDKTLLGAAPAAEADAEGAVPSVGFAPGFRY